MHGQTLTDWRVYAAEQSLPARAVFDGTQSLNSYLDAIPYRTWWQDRYGAPCPLLTASVGGRDLAYLGGWYDESFTWRDSFLHPYRFVLTVHPAMLRELVVLHELAHLLAPILDGDPDLARAQLAGGALPDIRELPSHGSLFAATLLQLTEQHGQDPALAELREALEHFEVEIASPSELVEVCTRQLDLHDLYLQMLGLDRARYDGSPPSPLPLDTGGRPPGVASPTAPSLTLTPPTHHPMPRTQDRLQPTSPDGATGCGGRETTRDGPSAGSRRLSRWWNRARHQPSAGWSAPPPRPTHPTCAGRPPPPSCCSASTRSGCGWRSGSIPAPAASPLPSSTRSTPRGPTLLTTCAAWRRPVPQRPGAEAASCRSA